MLFDLSPKERPEDFFNYEKELKALLEYIKAAIPITAVKGFRRTGKSSLMRVSGALHHMPYAWIDARTIHSKQGMREAIERAFKTLILKTSLLNRARPMELDLGPLVVELQGEEVWERVKGMDGVLYIDEAQSAERYGMADWLAHLYDAYPKLRVVVAGSQVGLLEGLLHKGPLKGRMWKEVELRPLDRQKALSFLIQGFSQLKMSVPLREMEEAVDELGGTVGWLAMYGHERAHSEHREALERVKDRAKEILLEELMHFLEKVRNKKAYLCILKAVASGLRDWSDIYAFTKACGGCSKGCASKAIARLKAHGWLTEDLELADPLLKLVTS